MLDLWNQMNKFPVRFEPMYMGPQVVDESLQHTQEMTQSLTHLVKELCKFIVLKNPVDAEKAIKKFMVKVGPRGLLTMLGMRKTVGSQDAVIPTAKYLLDGFNKLN